MSYVRCAQLDAFMPVYKGILEWLPISWGTKWHSNLKPIKYMYLQSQIVFEDYLLWTKHSCSRIQLKEIVWECNNSVNGNPI